MPRPVLTSPRALVGILAGVLLTTLSTGAQAAVARPVDAGPAQVGIASRTAPAKTWPKAPATCVPDGGGGSGVACTFSDGRARVTVDQTKNLINQTVSVAWSGLPETRGVGQLNTAVNGVAILQCWGADPTRDHCWPWDHYLSTYTNYSATDDPEEVEPFLGYRKKGLPPPFVTAAGKSYAGGVTTAPDYTQLPSNEVLGATATDGTGISRFEVRDKDQLRSLGCAAGHPCSLVVVPVINKLHDYDDSLDTYAGFGFQLSATNWNRRAVIPLDFAPQGAACPAANASVQVTTSEVAVNAVRRWQPALCSEGVAGVKVDAAVTTLSDRLTRDSLGNGQSDLAMVGRPVSTPGVTYAPLAGAGVAITFNITNQDTRRPFDALKVTPRLMAKLLTQSYCGFVCGDGQYPADPNTAHPAGASTNPGSMGEDPELFALNPQLETGTGDNRRSLVSGAGLPEVSFSDSDVFYRLTQWIDADPVARAWLDGKPDEYGMTVNKTFRTWQLPLDGPVKRDDFVLPKTIPGCGISCVYSGQNYLDLKYQFASNMAAAAANVVQGWPSATTNAKFAPDDATRLIGFGRLDPSTLPGSDRFILGVVSTAQAGAYGLPTAAVPGADGTFVQPTLASLSAAVAAATKDPRTGLWTVPPGAGGPSAYPMTLIEHAVARTSGLTKAVAAADSAFVTYAATDGQAVGTNLGQLPAGYVPVTGEMAAQSTAAAAVIAAAATTASPKPTSTPKVTSTPKPTSTSSPSPTKTLPVGTPTPRPGVSAVVVTQSPSPTTGSTSTPTSPTAGSSPTGTSGGGGGSFSGGGGPGGTSGDAAGAAAGGQSGTSGSAGSTGSDGTTTGNATGGTSGVGGSGGGSGTSTGPGASTGAGSGTAQGPVPAAGPTPGTGTDGTAVGGTGVGSTAEALSNTAGQAAQPGVTSAPAAGSLRWALLALLVLALAAGVSAPLLAGTDRGAKVLASVKRTFTR